MGSSLFKENAHTTYEISSKTVNNPGDGDCAFHAFAIGLIYIIQQESSEKRPMFNKWVKLDSSVECLFQRIMQFDMDHSDNGLLLQLQQSLRNIVYTLQANALHFACTVSNEQNDYQYLLANSSFNKFLMFYNGTERDPNYNEFVGNKEIIREINKIKKAIDPTAPYRALGALVKRLVLDRHGGLNQNSLIIQAIARIKNSIWGTHSDLLPLAVEFALKFHVVLENARPIQEYKNDDLQKHVITLKNKSNQHWETEILVVVPVRGKSPTELPAPGANMAAVPAGVEDSSDEAKLKQLKAEVSAATKAYCSYSKQILFSIFHRHWRSGRVAAEAFDREIQSIDNYQQARARIVEHLRDNKKGNKHPHSFKTMLLNGLLKGDQNNKPLLKNRSKYFNRYLRELTSQLNFTEQPKSKEDYAPRRGCFFW